MNKLHASFTPRYDTYTYVHLW